MPLKIELKSGDKIFINGAVIENGGTNTSLILHNEATIMREKELLSDDSAVTPASRVYYSLQCAYLFKDGRDGYLRAYDKFLDDYLAACPSAINIGNTIRTHVSEGRIFKGLKEAKNLILHEQKTLKTCEHDVSEIVSDMNSKAGEDDEPQDAE